MKKAAAEPMREMRIEMHRGPAPQRKLTGFTVHHHMVQKPSSKSSAFYEDTSHSVPFGADQHEQMLDHIDEHVTGQLGGGAGSTKAVAHAQEAENEKDKAGEECRRLLPIAPRRTTSCA